MNADYKVAVIGAGAIAGRHLKALDAMSRVRGVAVADVAEERAAACAQAYGLQPYGDYRRMLEAERPDIAIVTLPHHLHKEAVMVCAGLGIHLLLEKPMGLSVRECDDMIEAVRNAGVTLMVGHTQHYLPENRAAKARIDAGELGRLIMVQDTRHTDYFADSRPGWFFRKEQAGGGILANLGSHSVDKLQWLSGQRVELVMAQVCGPGPAGDIEAGGLVYLRTSGGVAASLCLSGYKGAPRNETELVFTGGMLRLSGGKLWSSAGGEYRQEEVPETPDPFVLQLEELTAALEEGREPECGADYSRSIVEVTEAVYRSGDTGVAVRTGLNRSEPDWDRT